MAMNVDRNAGNPQVNAAQGVQGGTGGQVGWKDAETVNQIHPDGDQTSQNYVDAAYNCGPAVAATLARMMGTRDGQSNASLINELAGEHGTTAEGTKPGNMLAMIKEVGGKVDGAVVGDYKDQQLDNILAKGDKAVMQVGLQNPDGKTGESTHWVLINGKDKDGNYLVKDPLKGDYKATSQQLRDAFHSAGTVGGALIAVAPQNAPARAQSLRSQGVNTGNYAPASTETPFTTDASRLEGVDPTFKQYSLDAFDDAPKHEPAADPNENLTLFKQAGLSGHDVETGAASVTKASNVNEAAKSILDLLKNDKDQGVENLNSVSNSHNQTDVQVFELLLKAFADQGGSGQRPGWASFGGF